MSERALIALLVLAVVGCAANLPAVRANVDHRWATDFRVP